MSGASRVRTGDIIEARLQGGFDKELLLQQLEEARAQLQMRGKEAEEDYVLEVMDYLVGWCSPGVRL